MSHTIKTVYVVHHSHTDIGYTDLQERVVQGQVNYIRSPCGFWISLRMRISAGTARPGSAWRSF